MAGEKKNNFLRFQRLIPSPPTINNCSVCLATPWRAFSEEKGWVEYARYTTASVFRVDPLIKSRESGRAGAEKGCVQGFQLSIAHKWRGGWMDARRVSRLCAFGVWGNFNLSICCRPISPDKRARERDPRKLYFSTCWAAQGVRKSIR